MSNPVATHAAPNIPNTTRHVSWPPIPAATRRSKGALAARVWLASIAVPGIIAGILAIV